MDQAPPIVDRPKLYGFIMARNLQWRDCEAPLGRSHEYIRRVCLPFADPKRIVPPAPFRKRAQDWTAGEITPPDFDPPGSTNGLTGGQDFADVSADPAGRDVQ